MTSPEPSFSATSQSSSARGRARAGEWLLLGLALAASAGCGWLLWQAFGRTAAPRPQHVLLISLDTLRPDHLSCYGYTRPTSPRLDALAAESWRFAHCAGVSNWTLPTHASLFTGLYPDVHGAKFLTPDEVEGVTTLNSTGVLLDECVTLAERLLAAGFQTAAVVANWGYLGRIYQVDQGFETYDVRAADASYQAYRTAETITDAAIRFLDTRDERPFCLFLNYMDTHHPYNPPSDYLDRFETDPQVERTPKPTEFYAELMTDIAFERREANPETFRWITNRYDASIAYLDHHLGRLFDELRRRGLYEDTLVIVTSDHGEGLGEHQVFGHCFRMYENELAVPLIVKLPGHNDPQIVGERVSQIDVLPTVIDVLELPARDEALDGQSLLDPRPRDLLAKKDTDLRLVEAPRPLNQTQWAVYRGPLKLIEYAAGPVELYDLATDPAEATNLADQRPDEVRDLRAAIAGFRQRLAPIAPLTSAIQARDPEAMRALRELGYAQ
ncbi:MAG: sulfatase-like hydrolase/transferase [Pirellulales bacterium]|nr:sulfatase-like hydrolase/transferase [Pirellulales bacterium]